MKSDKKFSIPQEQIIEFSTIEAKCVYLPQKRMKMSYKYIKNSTFSFNSELTKRGWRRFGEYYSRPCCNECSECKSLKIDVERFTFKNLREGFLKETKTLVSIFKNRPLQLLILSCMRNITNL